MPQKLITNIPTIARYSRHNEAANWQFRAYLKSHPNLSHKELDSIVAGETEQVWAQIDCLKCANCCKTLQIMVDDKDIRRLSNRLGLKQAVFVKRYVGVNDDGTKHLRSTPCAFLGPDNKCTVYDDRPQACRDFPYLSTPGFLRRSMMMIENNATCPIVFNVWQRLKERLWRGKKG